MRKYDAVIFDLDGTLLDSVWLWDQIDRDFLGEYGFSVPEDYSKAVMPLTFRETAEYTIRRFGISASPEEIMARWIHMAEEAYAQKIHLKEGAAELLSLLKQEGLKICAATAGEKSLFLPALQRNEAEEYFEDFTTASEAGCGKEKPDIYLLAAKKLGIPPERCLVFEDVYTCCLSAKRAGMHVFGVYDRHAETERERMEAACDRYVFSFSELLLSLEWLYEANG